MKKSVILILVILVIVAIGAVFFAFNGSQFGSDEEQGIIDDAGQTNLEGGAESSGAETEVGDEEAGQETEEESELFYPALTYDGAYNGPLYATSEQIGNYPDKAEYMSNLKRNGVNFFIGMFTILGKTTDANFVSHANLGYVADLAEKYPGMIVPFFGSGIGGEELESLVKKKDGAWVSMYKDVIDTSPAFAGEDFIRGFGEVETQEWSIRHNDAEIMKLVSLASSNRKHFMFHPVASKLDDVKTMIESYPDTIFLIHMYREDLKNGEQKLIDMMKTHDNLYYSIDAAHILHYDGNDILYSYYDSYGDNAGSRFISAVNSNYNSIMSSAVNEYKDLVEAVPDKVMWGTEAGPDYSFEPDVYNLLIKASRDFIAKVTDNPDEQEALGYKNALRVFGRGVSYSGSGLINTDSWPFCTEEQMGPCDTECGTEDEGQVNFEGEACFEECISEMACMDPLG